MQGNKQYQGVSCNDLIAILEKQRDAYGHGDWVVFMGDQPRDCEEARGFMLEVDTTSEQSPRLLMKGQLGHEVHLIPEHNPEAEPHFCVLQHGGFGCNICHPLPAKKVKR